MNLISRHYLPKMTIEDLTYLSIYVVEILELLLFDSFENNDTKLLNLTFQSIIILLNVNLTSYNILEHFEHVFKTEMHVGIVGCDEVLSDLSIPTDLYLFKI